MMWYKKDVPGLTPNVSYETNPISIFGYSIPKADIGLFNNCQEVYQNLWNIGDGIKDNSLSEMRLSPNPATEQIFVSLLSKENGNGILTVSNMMGQQVYSENVTLENGNNQYQINVFLTKLRFLYGKY